MSAKARNIVIRLLVALCALVVLALAAYGQEVNVKVVRFAGKVEVRTSGQTAWAKVQAGQLLKAGDTLRTLKGGKVQLLFPQNTLVLIKENSVLNVKELKTDGGSKVKTVVGGFLFNLQEALSPGSTFEVETPTALAVVRGTKLGVDVMFDGTSEFTGYDGTFEVVAQGVTREVGPGQKVGVTPGSAPGEVEGSDESWEGAGGEEEGAGVPVYSEQQYMSRFNTLANRFRLLAARMDEFYQEYIRYEAEGDTARTQLIWYSIQPLMEQCEQYDSDLAELVAALQADPMLGWVVSGGEPSLGTEDSGAAIQAYLAACQASSAQIHSQFDSIESYIGANSDPQEILDMIQGIIESTDPSQDIRYGNIDSDLDGIPDIVELRLSGEPGAEEPMVILIEPEDAAQFAYPDDDSIHFEFEALGEEYFSGFDLHLEAGGYEMVRPFVGTSMDLQLHELVAEESAFFSLFSEGENVEFTWFVRGHFDFNLWGADIGGGHHVSSLIDIDSETRTLNISYPAGQVVEFSLVPIGAVPVQMGEPIRLRVECSEVTNLGRWEIVVDYDPSLVEFSSGLHTGITSSTTLFFGDDGRGHLTISGEVGPTAASLSGVGAFAEIMFSTMEAGTALFDFSDIRLYTSGGQVIESITGDGAEVEIAQQPVA